MVTKEPLIFCHQLQQFTFCDFVSENFGNIIRCEPVSSKKKKWRVKRDNCEITVDHYRSKWAPWNPRFEKRFVCGPERRNSYW
jgi:hypothetical protein